MGPTESVTAWHGLNGISSSRKLGKVRLVVVVEAFEIIRDHGLSELEGPLGSWIFPTSFPFRLLLWRVSN